MARFITLIVVAATLIATTSVPQAAWAQQPQEIPGEMSTTSGPRKQLATIIFSGLAGAILGLSTLSFYGRPQEKLSNIAIGFAVGIIGGTVYTTYKAATQPYRLYGNTLPDRTDQLLLQNRQSHKQWQVGWSWDF